MTEIRFEKDNRRAAAYDGSTLAGECDVVFQKSFWVITHTEVNPGYSGQGIAGELVACVMDAAKKAGVKVKPFCSYAAHQFAKNPDYAEMEDYSVITVYGMKSCPDCSYVENQIEGNRNFNFIDIGDHVKNMKAFIRIRDNDAVFDDVKKSGSIGIPCFVLEDGTVTLKPEDVGLSPRPEEEDMPQGAACRLDGTGC